MCRCECGDGDERIKLTRQIFRFRCHLLVYQSVCNQTASVRKWSCQRLRILIALTSVSVRPIWLPKSLYIPHTVAFQISCNRCSVLLRDSPRPAVTGAPVNVSRAVKGQISRWETHDIRFFFSFFFFFWLTFSGVC